MSKRSYLDWGMPEPIPNLEQTGPLVLGSFARKGEHPGGGALPKISAEQAATVQEAKKFAMEQSIQMVMVKQTIAHQQNQTKSLQRHQAVILMCRIYVGSINFEVKEDTVRQAFLPFGPIRSITMSWDQLTKRHKGFGFVEYEVPEAAQLALEQMNGVIISGRNIKVGRPSNMPQAQAVIVELNEEAKKFNRIYISSIHADLTQEDIRSVFEAFGQITSCELALDPIPSRHRGYCFIEYATEQACLDAIGSMNLFDLGGQFLRVGRAITPPDTPLQITPQAVPTQSLPTAAAVAAAAASAKIQALDAVVSNLGISSSDVLRLKNSANLANAAAAAMACTARLGGGLGPSASSVSPNVHAIQIQNNNDSLTQMKRHQEDLERQLMAGREFGSLHQQENFSIRGKSERNLVMKKLMRPESESVVVVLRNMVTPDEVDQDLQEEVEEECSKYGSVERVIIYQERQSEDDEAEILVKIFVQFKSPSIARSARDALHERYFGGRIISAQIYNQNLFDHNDFSG